MLLRIGLLLLAFIPVSILGFGVPKVRITSGSITGVYFPVASSISKIINKSKHYKSEAMISSGSVENIHRLLNGEAEIAVVQSDTLFLAYNGQPPFNPKTKARNLRAIASLYPEQLHILAHKTCLRKKTTELNKDVFKQCTFNLGPKGSGTYNHATLVMRSLGIDMKGSATESFPDTVEQMTQGKLQGAFFTVGNRSLSIIALMKTGEFQILSLPKKTLQSILKTHPQLSETQIAKDTYPHQTGTVNTLAVFAQIATTTERLSDNSTREIIEMMLDNIQSIRAAHQCGKQFSLQTALDGINIPVQNGAKEFYVQQGVLSPIFSNP